MGSLYRTREMDTQTTTLARPSYTWKMPMDTRNDNYKTIHEYIALFPEDVRVILEKVRQTIKRAAPEAVEAIAYQMPTFKLNSKNLVHLPAGRTI